MELLEPTLGLAGEPETILLWGRHRLALDLMAYGIARRIDPELIWLYPYGSHNSPAEEDACPRRALDPRQVWGFDATADSPTDGASLNLAKWLGAQRSSAYARRGSSPYIELPAIIQQAVDHLAASFGQRAMVLSGAESLNSAWADQFLSSGALLDHLRTQKITIVVSYAAQPPEVVKEAFGEVFRLEPEPGRHWVESFVQPERLRGRKEHRLGVPLPARQSVAFSGAIEDWASSFFERPKMPEPPFDRGPG